MEVRWRLLCHGPSLAAPHQPVQNPLHEDEVEPAAELAADLEHARDFDKPHL
jgi:hypothetical protein